MNRVRTVKTALWFILGAAAVVALSRFVFGLGATTALTDLTPWGFWIGFDVMGGVALAAGGFVVAAVVYVLGMKKYKPVARAAVLTAMLGYMAVVGGLLFDLGLPWNIWHLIVFWNPSSPLFEVGWCVMLYLTVLVIEFLPVMLELSKRPLLQKIHSKLTKYTLVFVFLGIMLSTLHQSSLGSLFLIQPHRLHPLWYTSLLPVLFFVSAIGLGLMMVVSESLTTSWLYKKKPETDVLAGLARAAIPVFIVYLALRFGDLAWGGNLRYLAEGSVESGLFVAEILMSAIVPLVILLVPRWRLSRVGLGLAAGLAVFGFAFNRINVGGLAMVGSTGTRYIPSWMEVTLSAGVVAAAALAFFFFVERFRVWNEPAYDRSQWDNRPPSFDPASMTWRRDPNVGDLARNSFAFVLAAALAFALLPSDARSGPQPKPQRAQRALGGDVLVIDGNRNGDFVRFNHRLHQEKAVSARQCGSCHHMNLPRDEGTSCATCHRDWTRSTDIFSHNAHVKATGGTRGCVQCHADSSKPKGRDTATPCMDCHKQMIAPGAFSRPASPNFRKATGYLDSLHGLCVGCHQSEVRKGKRPQSFAYCGQCHRQAPVRLDPKRPHLLPEAPKYPVQKP